MPKYHEWISVWQGLLVSLISLGFFGVVILPLDEFFEDVVMPNKSPAIGTGHGKSCFQRRFLTECFHHFQSCRIKAKVIKGINQGFSWCERFFTMGSNECNVPLEQLEVGPAAPRLKCKRWTTPLVSPATVGKHRCRESWLQLCTPPGSSWSRIRRSKRDSWKETSNVAPTLKTRTQNKVAPPVDSAILRWDKVIFLMHCKHEATICMSLAASSSKYNKGGYIHWVTIRWLVSWATKVTVSPCHLPQILRITPLAPGDMRCPAKPTAFQLGDAPPL